MTKKKNGQNAYLRDSLKQWMRVNDKNETDIASLTGVSVNTVKRFLTSKTDPQPLVVKAFEKVLAVHI